MSASFSFVAKSTYAAMAARRKLKVTWDESTASKDSWSKAVEEAKKVAKQSGPESLILPEDVVETCPQCMVGIAVSRVRHRRPPPVLPVGEQTLPANAPPRCPVVSARTEAGQGGRDSS